jgi:hypothetical protein
MSDTEASIVRTEDETFKTQWRQFLFPDGVSAIELSSCTYNKSCSVNLVLSGESRTVDYYLGFGEYGDPSPKVEYTRSVAFLDTVIATCEEAKCILNKAYKDMYNKKE